MNKFILFCCLVIISLAFATEVSAAETFPPYKADEVPQNVAELWKDYDARQESLDIKVVKEWKEDGTNSNRSKRLN